CVGEELQHGYVLSEDALSQIQVGSSREQVLLVLGTPTTTATFGGEAFYYISSKTARPVAFMNHATVDQRVLAIYF
ncbi:outer membrane protein assembly factor BamE, partial [Mycobacterium tuberculosis]|nr:outer membrane protein assembly factor BamE [Mycobacterium tuberculosis]